MRILVPLLLCVVTARAAPPPRVGVAPARIDVTEDAPLDDSVFTEAVARGLGTGHVDVVPTPEVRAMAVRAARAGLVCDARDVACAARLAAFAGLDFIVATVARDLDEGAGVDLEVELTLVDGANGASLRQRRAPLDGGGVVDGVAAVAAALISDAVVPGRLEVRGPAGAAVDVDGVVRGTTPLALDVGAGLHRVDGRVVRVPAAGVAVVERADVAGAGDVDVALPLAVTAGVGLSLALGAGIGAVVVAPDVARRDAYTARGWNDAVATGQALVAAASIGGAVAVIAGGLWATSTWVEPRREPG